MRAWMLGPEIYMMKVLIFLFQKRGMVSPGSGGILVDAGIVQGVSRMDCEIQPCGEMATIIISAGYTALGALKHLMPTVVITMQLLQDLMLWDAASAPCCPAPGDQTVGCPLQPLPGPRETPQPLLCATCSMGSAPHSPQLAQQHAPSTQHHGVGWRGAPPLIQPQRDTAKPLWSLTAPPGGAAPPPSLLQKRAAELRSRAWEKPLQRSCLQKGSAGRQEGVWYRRDREGRVCLKRWSRTHSLNVSQQLKSRPTVIQPSEKLAAACKWMIKRQTDTKFPSLQSIATTLPLNKSRF